MSTIGTRRRQFLQHLAGVAPFDPSDASTLPVAEPGLSLLEQAAMYAVALSDRDAYALSKALGPTLRLDPPVRSYRHASPGATSRAVVLPMVSYATGATLGFLHFGHATVDDPDGSSHAMPVRFMVCHEGKVRIALDQAVQICPEAQLAEPMFAGYPQEA